MKRPFLYSILICSLTAGVQAARVSTAEALVIAGEFFATRGIRTHDIRPVAGNTRSGEQDAPYHLFNIGEGEGFIIVAGDDRMPSVLGYSTEGSISPDNMPEACRAWLDAHADAISSFASSPSTFDPSLLTLDSSRSAAVAPLLKTKWDQTAPYNLQCPIDNATGLHSAVGCVATAAAQVMGYYKYPTQPSGKIEYEDRNQNETRTFDFSAMSPIDWELITDTYSADSSADAREAVATLMNAVAHGVRMQFSSGTSTAYHYNAGHALIDFFGYSPDIHYYERALVSDEEWISIITSELQAGRPVLYEGVNPSMGHAFVCDGHDGQGYFHINWGWSGLSDGYFSLSGLTPPNQSTGGSASGYNLRQTIVCNIAPKGTPGLQPQKLGLLNIDKLYFRDSSSFHYAAEVPTVTSPLADAQLFFYSFNKGMKPFTGEVCAAITDGEELSPVATTTIDALASQNYTTVRFPLASAALPDGTHRIGFYYRTSPEGKWHPVGSSTPGAPSQCYVTISGNQVTMNSIEPSIIPEKTESIHTSRLYSNSTATMSFELENSGTTRLEAHAGVAVMDKEGQYLAFYSTPVLCPAEDSITVEIEANLKGLPSGECLLMPFYSYSSAPTSTDIHPLSSQPFPAVVESVVITPAEGSYFMVNPDKTILDINIANLVPHDWTASIGTEIVTQSGTVIGSLPASELTLGPSAYSSLEFDCSGLTLARGSYMARFSIAEENPIAVAEIPMMVTADIASVAGVEAEGIEISIAGDITVTSFESIASVSLYDTSGRLISDHRNPGNDVMIPTSSLSAGIYILRIATESGKSVTQKLRL